MTARQRTRDIFVYVVGIVVVGGIVASFFATKSEVNDVGSRVTKVESPCLRYGPKSPECKAAFEAAVATITHPEACAIERKAGTLRAIRELAAGLEVTFKEPCAGARLAQERQRGSERAATREQGGNRAAAVIKPASGGVPSPGTPGDTQPPAPHHPASHPVHQPPNSGGEGGHEPPAPGAQPPHPEVVAPAGKEPANVIPSTPETVGEAIGGVVGTAEGAVEQAGCAVRWLLNPCP
jgi:hypothetical protein